MAVGISTIFQLLPLCNGILLMMTLGSMFGTVKGVAIASVAATSSALVCMLIARTVSPLSPICTLALASTCSPARDCALSLALSYTLYVGVFWGLLR